VANENDVRTGAMARGSRRMEGSCLGQAGFRPRAKTGGTVIGYAE